MHRRADCALQGPPGPPPAASEAQPTIPGREMTQNYDNLVAAVEAVRPDVEKAEKGNKAATSRVRKSMQEVKAIAQEIRKEMLELRDAGGAG